MKEELIKLRHVLHQNPELSGFEENTARIIREFVKSNSHAEIIDKIGGHGLAIVYNFPLPGPTVVVRCELDALPISEMNNFDHRSKANGIAHKCGHDGHMAIISGLVYSLNTANFKKGKVVLLFQPAEENGQGAQAVINDPKFRDIEPDYMFALHNIPGVEKHTIIQVPKVFSPTVESTAIYLQGKECHAAQPGEGLNPAAGISEILSSLALMNNHDPKDDLFSVLTPVYVTMGQKAYGLSPGRAELHFTLRAWTQEVMDALKAHLVEIVDNVCDLQGLNYHMDWFEYFPTTHNSTECNALLEKVAGKNNLILEKKEFPFRFGEDFGWFSKRYKTAMFGLGAGLETPALHHETYDFPDDIIETGVQMFYGIIEEILG